MKVLFISVHPDDETLGCGGTILKYKQTNSDIFWLILTEASEKTGYSPEFVDQREKQIIAVNNAYGFNNCFMLNFPTTKLHEVPFEFLHEKISHVFHEIKPDIVYTINRSDVHTDHQVASKAVAGCVKSFRSPFIKKIFMYECISETEMSLPLQENAFIPNSYSDISNFIDQKLEIMKLYGTEVQEPPYPRSLENIKALARFRGSSAFMHYAEAFMLLREFF